MPTSFESGLHGHSVVVYGCADEASQEAHYAYDPYTIVINPQDPRRGGQGRVVIRPATERQGRQGNESIILR